MFGLTLNTGLCCLSLPQPPLRLPLSTRPVFFFFFFNDTATTEIYTLSLHDALPISPSSRPPTTRGARSAATRRSVEAPAPTAPTSATTSPPATSSDTSASAEIGRAHV